MANQRFPLLYDIVWLRTKYETEQLSIVSIAALIPCSATAVQKALRKNNIVARPAHGPLESLSPAEFSNLNNREWMYDHYVVKGYSCEKIARAIGCTGGAVLKALRRLNIKTRQQKGKGRLSEPLPGLLKDPEWLYQQFIVHRRTATSIGREVNCTPEKVGSALRKWGISRKHKGRYVHVLSSNVFPLLGDATWLQNQYLNLGKQASVIAVELNCSEYAVRAALVRFRLLKYPGRPMTKKRTDLPSGVMAKNGYLFEHVPDHPFANHRGYVAQHRLVVEEQIGRYLSPEEEPHHLDERRENNSPENLLLMSCHAAHFRFHHNPPAWVPRCECCQRPRPELITGRPADVPIIWPDGYPTAEAT